MWGREAYTRWAPLESPWSPWVKPTLFAQNPEVVDTAPSTTPLIETVPPDLREEQLLHLAPADGRTLIVSELPALQSVQLAVMLAKRGWRPVPLFNATHDTKAEVPQGPIIRAMMGATDELAFAHLPPEAPPLFLLDALRKGQRSAPPPGTFDNRSIVFPQDFPSGNLLLSRGIKSALVVVNGATTLSDDLIHVLRRWQETGLTISHDNFDTPDPPEVLNVPKPSGFGPLLQRVLAGFGLRRNSAGGFGARVPIPSQGGHGFRHGLG